jgi:hypothetical protein
LSQKTALEASGDCGDCRDFPAAAAERCVETIPHDLRLRLAGLLPELLAR